VSSNYQPTQFVAPDCSQSNWAAGVDMMLMLGTGIASGIETSTAASEPAVTTSSQQTSDIEAAIALGGLALLTGYSMVRGFQKSSDCRSATEAAGIPSRGENDWLISWAVLLTVGAAALARAGGDPDSCSPGAVHTAVCRDGWESCSLHRGGTCSHHQGVGVWL
jgi:hypothetical protein